MWYASPLLPCCTAIARLPDFFRLNASACFCRSAKFRGTFASWVLTISAMFSIATGAPYRRFTAVP
jgi:hypothetical protein